MSTRAIAYTPYQLAHAVRSAISACGQDGPQLLHRLRRPITRFLDTDVSNVGVKRQGNHIDDSKYIYYDGEIHITVDVIPKGKVIPPHDHGVWECMSLFSGKMKHTVYRRTDDGSVEGVADLEVCDHQVMEKHDLAMVAPPAEIHSFTALTDDTVAMTIVGGHYKEIRHYYDVDAGSYRAMAPGTTGRIVTVLSLDPAPQLP